MLIYQKERDVSNIFSTIACILHLTICSRHLTNYLKLTIKKTFLTNILRLYGSFSGKQHHQKIVADKMNLKLCFCALLFSSRNRDWNETIETNPLFVAAMPQYENKQTFVNPNHQSCKLEDFFGKLKDLVKKLGDWRPNLRIFSWGVVVWAYRNQISYVCQCILSMVFREIDFNL